MASEKIDLALAFLKSEPGMAASILEQYPTKEVVSFLEAIPSTHVALVLEKMLPFYTAKLCQQMDPAVSVVFLSKMEIGLLASIMRYLSKKGRQPLLASLPKKKQVACKLLLAYPQSAVGAWMNTHVMTLPHDCTVEEAQARMTTQNEYFHNDLVYLVDRNRLPKGAVSTLHILGAAPNTSISTFSNSIPTIFARTELLSVGSASVWSDRDTVVVINRNQQFVGVLRHADLRKGIEQLSSAASPRFSDENIISFGGLYGKSLLALFNTACEMSNLKK